jgi:hypothetical protein
MYDALHNGLHSLQAVKSTGFAGLILALISHLTGHTFFLAKSGAQAGKDASTARYGATYIDIECRKYRRGKSPRTRGLIGGFDEAIDASAGRLDLWLVVSTGAIGTNEAASLRRIADREAVALEIIDWQAAGLPRLAILYASRLLNWREPGQDADPFYVTPTLPHSLCLFPPGTARIDRYM